MVENEMQQVIDRYMELWKLHDVEKIAALWTEDGDLLNPWGVWARGRAGVQKILRQEHSGPFQKSTMTNKIVHSRSIDPKANWVEVEAAVVGMLGASGEELPPFKHHCIYLLVKDSEDNWKIASARAYQLLGPLAEIS